MLAAALLTLASISIPFDFAGDEIFVPVRVNGSAPMWFSLDSGASSTIIDSTRARELGLTAGETVEGRGAGSGTVAYTRLSSPVSLAVGRLPASSTTLLSVDLIGPAKNAGHAMDGILGYEFFARSVVAIDYQRRRVTVTDPDACHPPRGYTPLPLYVYKKVPFVDAELKVPGVAATTGRFLIDTGSADAVDHPLIKQSTGEVHTTVTGVGLGQPTTGWWGTADYFKLGPCVIRSPAVACCGGNELNQQMIGAAILKHFRLIFDYPHERLYVRALS